MRLFLAIFNTETNTFAPIPTSWASFEELLYAPAERLSDSTSRASVDVARQLDLVAGMLGVEFSYGPFALAQPGGVTTKSAYAFGRDNLLNALRNAGPVDGVVLSLHGAMVADGCLDCEGDILRRVRDIVGDKTPIGVLLDPHCHLTSGMLAATPLIVCYKEYPHTDINERMVETIGLVTRTARGEIRPEASVFDCRMISLFPTTAEPMRGFVDRIRALEGKDSVLSVSVVHGFPWGDTPDMGAKVVVVTDSARAHGDTLANQLGHDLIAMRHTLASRHTPLDQAVKRVLAATGGPIVLADGADNTGAGAPGDSTFILRALLDAGVDNAAMGLIWDPHAVGIAAHAGEGARLTLRIGGKTCALSGEPVDLPVEVLRVRDDAHETFGGMRWPFGRAAAVRGGGIDLVLVSNRVQCFTPQAFEQFGIDPRAKRALAVKSTHHFHEAFAPIAQDVLFVDAHGVASANFRSLPYQHVRRPIWPLDADLHDRATD